MNIIRLELTEREAEIYEEVVKKMDKTAVFLASFSHEERLDWRKERQYSYPISFEREIGGTVYTVNAHFNDKATELTEEKVNRILSQNITL